jgi:hypothetical protein
LARQFLAFVVAALPTLGLLGCAVVNGSADGKIAWQPAKLSKAQSAAHIRAQLPVLSGGSDSPKIIFIGVQGGNPPPWDDAEFFDPQQWPPYRNVDLADEAQLNRIAYHESVMHVIALHVARKYSNSVTLMVRGDSGVVADVLDAIYNPGDKLLLAGHSFGGGVIEEVAKGHRRRNIPIELLAFIESFWSSGVVPNNVRRAVNFYVPTNVALCPGQNRIRAEDDRATALVNISVPDPQGPYGGFCAAHRNIDSDPRVWKPLLGYVLQSASP